MIAFRSKLAGDRRGSIAIIAAVGSFLLVLGAGGTIDYNAHVKHYQEMQNAVDAAALIYARKYATSLTTPDLTGAKDLVAANLNTNLGVLQAANASVDGSQLTVTADGYTDTYFLGLASIDRLPVHVKATAVWGDQEIELALVLDNTASMLDSGKFTALKTAANELIDTLSKNIKTKSKRKFAIVPFANFVNVGSTNKTASWIDSTGVSPIHSTYFTTAMNRLNVYTALGKTWPGCVETRPSPYDIDDTTPTLTNPSTLFVPSFHPDEPDNGFKIGYYTYAYANNYLTDTSTSSTISRTTHSQKYVTQAGKDFSNSALYSNYSKPKGPGLFCDTTAITALSTNEVQSKKAVDDMVAIGSTNIPEGLAWGWRVLSPGAPFTEGSAYGPTVRKFVVLLTDGTNSVNTFDNELQSAYSSWGYGYSGRLGANPGVNLRDGLDAKMKSLCTKVKAAGLEIVTIGLMIDDTAAQSLLKECASASNYYFNSPSASQLSSIFKEIADLIMRPRLAT